MKLIDADKLLEWMSGIPIGFTDKFEQRMKAEIAVGTFDPTPVQPDIKPGDKVRHKDKKFEPYGVGIVKEIAKSGKQAYVEWPNYNKQHFRAWGPPSPAYYRLDKLEVIK